MSKKKKITPTLEILHHNVGIPDWCHLCGNRGLQLADVRYAYNVEHDKRRVMFEGKYVRICADCADAVAAAAREQEPPRYSSDPQEEAMLRRLSQGRALKG